MPSLVAPRYGPERVGHLLIGRFTLGSEVGYGIRLRDGTFVEPHIGLTGILNFHSDDLVINGVLVTPNGTRAKVDAGVLIKSPSGASRDCLRWHRQKRIFVSNRQGMGQRTIPITCRAAVLS